MFSSMCEEGEAQNYVGTSECVRPRPWKAVSMLMSYFVVVGRSCEAHFISLNVPEKPSAITAAQSGVGPESCRSKEKMRL